MIQLIQNIEGNVTTEIKGDVIYFKNIEANIQREDFVNIYSLIAFLQNLSQTPKTSKIVTPLNFGYTPPLGITTKNLDINY
jgi:hypothetical protein